MKRTAIILLFTTLFSLMFFTIGASAYSTDGYSNGDVNVDGRVNIKDATEIQKYSVQLVTLSEDQIKLADYNLDGEVNILDVTEIQQVLAQLKDAPVEPSTDPTSESSETEEPTTEEPATSESSTDQSASTQTPSETSSEESSSTDVTTESTTTEPTTATQPTTTVSENIDIYFTNSKGWSTVCFYLYNSETGDVKTAWPGDVITEKTTNSYGEEIYTATVDVSKYNRIIFNNGDNGQQTVNTPLTKASSGFFIQSGSGTTMMPGTYAMTGADAGTLVTTTLEYSTGYDKKIWIWTPAGYSATSSQQYKTIYMMDGQNLFDEDHSDSYGGWEVTDAVESLMANGGEGYIIVGIDNGNSKRDSELTPDIGEVLSQYQSEFSSRTGEAFSDFVVNKVMPYVQANYNSSTSACDNTIAGSSSGGLEAFYIGMENYDKFGNIGALSPAFALFSDSTWESYLSKFDLTSADMPRTYIYNGNGDSTEQELYAGTVSLYNRLVSSGYSTSKITLVLEENACHNEGYWRIVFPEMLCWCYQI